MNRLQKTIASGIATASLLGNLALPVFAQNTLEISGNGALSNNFVNLSQNTSTNVSQNNDANVDNNVDASANTGGNSSMFNTGGFVGIGTGNATTNVTVDNVLNSNTAEVDCCEAGNTSLLIRDNGAKSLNALNLNQSSNVDVDQDNDADVDNDVDASAKTGGNSAGWNTGADVVAIETGNASTSVSLSTTANANVARVSGPSTASTLSMRILDNGALSDNFITADLDKETSIDQDNDADVDNDVDADANSGYNDAEFNTGGDVVVLTGNARTAVDVDNLVNFNFADVDCGCVWGVDAKIGGNGALSDSVLAAYLDSFQNYDQDNDADLDNDVDDAYAKTGYNDSGWNTSGNDGDPTTLTGNATSTVNVDNVGNSNVIGDGPEFPSFPEMEFDWDMSSVNGWFMGFLAHFAS